MNGGGQLTDHLATARAGTNVELELECLLMLAAAERGRGHPAQARDHLDELTALADRGGYRHILAQAAIIRAELAQTEHRHTDAITAATDAYRLAWCEGPPHTYFWNLKHAEELLHNLDAPIPNAE